jgi:hypothetical protein
MFSSPSILLNLRRPAEQEKKRTLVDFSLLFLDMLKTFCPLFFPVPSASADGSSSGGGLLRRGGGVEMGCCWPVGEIWREGTLEAAEKAEDEGAAN